MRYSELWWAPKLMSFILTSTRPLVLYLTTNFCSNCGLQVFQADSANGTYQTDPRLWPATISLLICFLCNLVSHKAISLDPYYFSLNFTLIIHFMSTFTVLYLVLQMTSSSALDLLPTLLMNNSYNMTLTCCLTRVLDPFYVSILPSVCIFSLELTELLLITWQTSNPQSKLLWWLGSNHIW